VVEALLDLLQEGEVDPTARQVSDRSGVSMRSIFRLFEDVEALHAAAIAANLERVAHLFAAPTATGPVEDRVAALVAQRTRLYETIAPVRRAAIRLAPRSALIAAELARSDAVLRGHLAPLFASELDAWTEPRRAEVTEALDALTSWETWDRLRTAQRLDAGAAAGVVSALVRSAVGADDPHA
jgi:AcrR family transcriptional regulator